MTPTFWVFQLFTAQLSAEAVEANARTYLQQLGQGQDPTRALLDFETPGRLEVRRNSEWLAGLDLPQVVELLGIATVGQMLALEAMDCLQAQAHTPKAACLVHHSIVVQGTRYTRQAQTSPQGQSTDLMVQVSWPNRRVVGASSDHSDPQIIWRSSVSNLSSWVGVSSP